MNRSLLIKPSMKEEYPTVTHGEGIYLYDKDGKRYIDGSSGAVTTSIGHGVSEIIEAMHEQANKVSFVYRSQFTSEPAEKLAVKLNELLNADEDYWSFFVNSGSEATETAMKIAIQHWQEQGYFKKNKILSRWVSYHGITLGALSMSGHVGRRERFVSILEDYPAVSAPYCYQCSLKKTYPSCQLACANEIETAIKRIGPGQIAAFIAEPIIGAAGGVIIPPDGYYQQVKEICNKYNILFIADEVMTGIGRTGEMFGLHHWGIQADIIALGKGMSAGYTAIAATLASEKVMKPILQGSNSVMSGHTYSANPQSAATALAVLQYIEKYQLVQNVKVQGEYLLQKLLFELGESKIIGDIRGIGLMIGVEFVSDKSTKRPFDKKLMITNKIVGKAREKGLLVYPSSAGQEGAHGDAIIISPPFIITKSQMDELVSILKEVVLEIQKEVGGVGHDGTNTPDEKNE
ncbi:aspartate aminotransferase family protein [Metabacillus halosaccharovorans]|uniref:Aspartate aminotransferase family protein n=1 Tax=Metabacillus halosaccharovorans TaxID=930124 RepID=A0ABT3DAS8_9BACI|nr:aspartate aminotransferase family protein [Metabacillus halosaccharovorans]MCV9884158.1 aspartate aminotransferase family protein [Metabacillus halosaccharovorans]